MKISKPYPFCRHAIEIGGRQVVGTEATNVSIALVIGENDHEVRKPVGRSQRS